MGVQRYSGCVRCFTGYSLTILVRCVASYNKNPGDKLVLPALQAAFGDVLGRVLDALELHGKTRSVLSLHGLEFLGNTSRSGEGKVRASASS